MESNLFDGLMDDYMFYVVDHFQEILRNFYLQNLSTPQEFAMLTTELYIRDGFSVTLRRPNVVEMQCLMRVQKYQHQHIDGLWQDFLNEGEYRTYLYQSGYETAMHWQKVYRNPPRWNNDMIWALGTMECFLKIVENYLM